MEKKTSKIKIISVTRSFSYKKSLGNYQMADFFCSQTAECNEKNAEKTSEEVYKFCKKEVVKSLNEFERNGLLEEKPQQKKISEEYSEKWQEQQQFVKSKIESEPETKEPGDGFKQTKE